MIGRLVPPLLLALCVRGATPQGTPVATEDVQLSVTAGATEVGFGVAFPLTVVRTWSRSMVPDALDDAVLAPLVLRPIDVAVREDAERFEETRRYRAYLFQSGDVVVPAPWFRARGAGGETTRVAFADDLEFRVAPALPPGEPGPVELPGDVSPAPFSWTRTFAWCGIALAALGLGGWTLWRRRSIGKLAPPPAPAHVRALARLHELRAAEPRGRESVHAWFVDVAAALRAYVAERFALRAPELPTEELVAAARAGDVIDGARLGHLALALQRCDLVKFAAREPDDDDRGQLLGLAETFVRETAAPASPPGSGAA